MACYTVFMDTHFTPSELDLEPRLAEARALDARLVAARRAQRAAEHELALLLAELAEGELYRVLGYISLENYAFVALELPWRTARDLLRLGRCLLQLPVLNAAMAAGQIDWTKARELVRVVTPETEPTWVERAMAVTSRVLERDVAAANFGDAAPAGDPAPERTPARGRVWFEMETADAEVLRAALALLRCRSDLDRSEVEDGALLAAMARMVIAAEEAQEPSEFDAAALDPAGVDMATLDRAGVDLGALDLAGVDPVALDLAVHSTDAAQRPSNSAQRNTGERYRVVLQHCPTCRKVTALDGDVSETIGAEALCDAEIVDMRPGPTEGHATRKIAPALRRRVLHRAHWHCEIPGCRNRLWLDVHHTDLWAKSKRHEFKKLMVLCSPHHRATHEGGLAVELEDVGPSQCCVVEHADGRRLVGPARSEGG